MFGLSQVHTLEQIHASRDLQELHQRPVELSELGYGRGGTVRPFNSRFVRPSWSDQDK